MSGTFNIFLIILETFLCCISEKFLSIQLQNHLFVHIMHVLETVFSKCETETQVSSREYHRPKKHTCSCVPKTRSGIAVVAMQRFPLNIFIDHIIAVQIFSFNKHENYKQHATFLSPQKCNLAFFLKHWYLQPLTKKKKNQSVVHIPST